MNIEVVFCLRPIKRLAFGFVCVLFLRGIISQLKAVSLGKASVGGEEREIELPSRLVADCCCVQIVVGEVAKAL